MSKRGEEGLVAAPLRLAVSGLWKRYCQDTRQALRYALADIAREALPSRARPGLRAGESFALADVNFTVHAGEAVAILGENGSGKSTLLKLVIGLLKPSAGEVRRIGSVGAILELGTGLNPALTGRENVELGATLAGVPQREVKRLIDQVFEFSELDTAMEAPFRTYSTGMKMRLAYALATQLKPDILLVDEALAVGDMHFQRKCIAHMRDYVDRGGALLLVSHNTYQIQAVCNRGILLEQGQVKLAGTAIEALSLMFERRHPPITSGARANAESGPVRIDALRVEPVGAGKLETGQPARISVRYTAQEAIEVWWGFSIWTGDMAICVTGSHDLTARGLQPGTGELTCELPALPLIPGRYRVSATIIDSRNSQAYAESGRDDSPTFLDVSGYPDRLLNAQIHMGQLTTIDVKWN